VVGAKAATGIAPASEGGAPGSTPRDSDLWHTYGIICKAGRRVMCKVEHHRKIYPIFRELFGKREPTARAKQDERPHHAYLKRMLPHHSACVHCDRMRRACGSGCRPAHDAPGQNAYSARLAGRLALSSVIQKLAQFVGTHAGPKLLECLGLDLSNALSSHIECPAHLLQRVIAIQADTKSHAQDPLLARRQS
jgi:hypothetical protein